MKNRDFMRYGVEFHLNNTPRRTEYDGKYTLLYWNNGFESWVQLCRVSSKKEAFCIIADMHQNHTGPFYY